MKCDAKATLIRTAMLPTKIFSVTKFDFLMCGGGVDGNENVTRS